MSVQSAFGAVLLVGLPLMLLAVGVLAHAYYVARPRSAARTDRLIEDLIAESMDQLLAELRATSGRVEGSRPAPLPPLTVAPPAAHAFSALGTGDAPSMARAAALPAASLPTRAASHAPLDLRGAVAQLLTEGLSDRSIARRLGVGIEEVRAARLHRAPRSAA